MDSLENWEATGESSRISAYRFLVACAGKKGALIRKIVKIETLRNQDAIYFLLLRLCVGARSGDCHDADCFERAIQRTLHVNIQGLARL